MASVNGYLCLAVSSKIMVYFYDWTTKKLIIASFYDGPPVPVAARLSLSPSWCCVGPRPCVVCVACAVVFPRAKPRLRGIDRPPPRGSVHVAVCGFVAQCRMVHGQACAYFFFPQGGGSPPPLPWTPPPQTKVTTVGEKRNLRQGNSCRTIFGVQTFRSHPPRPPSSR